MYIYIAECYYTKKHNFYFYKSNPDSRRIWKIHNAMGMSPSPNSVLLTTQQANKLGDQLFGRGIITLFRKPAAEKMMK